MLWMAAAFGLMLALAGGDAGAAVYRCQQDDGTVTFTDNPGAATGDCQLQSVPPLGVVPASPPPQVTVPGAGPSVPDAPSGHDAPGFESFRHEAAQLVERYQAARQQLVFSSYVTDKLEARRVIGDIKTEKATLLDALERSPLTRSEKAEISGTLAAIAE